MAVEILALWVSVGDALELADRPHIAVHIGLADAHEVVGARHVCALDLFVDDRAVVGAFGDHSEVIEQCDSRLEFREHRVRVELYESGDDRRIGVDVRLAPGFERSSHLSGLVECVTDIGTAQRLEPQGETDIGSDTVIVARLVELDTDSVLAEFEARVALLNDLTVITEGTHHSPIVHEEIERADVARASYFVGIRKTDVNGDVRAIGELQRVTGRHPTSKNFNRHLLKLANLYAELAVEYSSTYPPESLLFDPVRFQELVEGASRLYETVASRDGTPEKLEASRRLEAFLAFSIRIDRDRFTP